MCSSTGARFWREWLERVRSWPGLGGARPAFAEEDPSAGLYPAPRNEAFKLDREVTPERLSARYNNFYEFGSHKQIAEAAQALKIRPWEVVIDGLCDNPQTIAIDDLLKKVQLEERLYRLRCVEAWSMAVPWSGFALADLVRLASPKAGGEIPAHGNLPRPGHGVGTARDMVSLALC